MVFGDPNVAHDASAQLRSMAQVIGDNQNLIAALVDEVFLPNSFFERVLDEGDLPALSEQLQQALQKLREAATELKDAFEGADDLFEPLHTDDVDLSAVETLVLELVQTNAEIAEQKKRVEELTQVLKKIETNCDQEDKEIQLLLATKAVLEHEETTKQETIAKRTTYNLQSVLKQHDLKFLSQF